MRLPAYVQMEPVGQCNLRCKMCSIQFREDGPPFGPLAFMEFDAFTAMVDEFEGVEDLHLQGLGEPMMHPRFFDMVEYAVAKGIRVSTNSNFTLLNARRAERCVRSGLHKLHVSIDGATPETYELIRVRAHFDRVMRNLQLFAEARERTGAGPSIRMIVVAMRLNLHEFPDLVRLAHRWGIYEVFVQHLCHDFGESTLPQRYRPMREFVQEQTLLEEDPARVDYYFTAAREAAEELGVELRLPRVVVRSHPPGTPGRKRCSWPWDGAYISYQGYAMPCCMVSTPDRMNFGNMAEQGVEAIWSNEEFERFRAQLDSDDPPEICRTCAIYNGTF